MASIKTRTVTTYECSICGHNYSTQQEAEGCEQRKVLHDKGVKVGDTVKITYGSGAGKLAKVTQVYVIDKNWGHYAWEKYWHTVALGADIIGEYGSRQLTYDNYETVGQS